MRRSHWVLLCIFLMFLLQLIIIRDIQVSYAQSRASRYGITATITADKLQYAPGEIVKFSAFITNNNPYEISVWDGCHATIVSTFSVLRVDNGQSVYEWEPTGASCNYLYPVRINASQSYQLGAVGLGENLTWDQRSGTPDSPGAFVDPGRYTIGTNIAVVGFNPSGIPCQPSGEDCVQGIDHTFTLQTSLDIRIAASVNEFTALPMIVVIVIAMVIIVISGIVSAAIMMHRTRQRQGNALSQHLRFD
jgi:hypothetical protein